MITGERLGKVFRAVVRRSLVEWPSTLCSQRGNHGDHGERIAFGAHPLIEKVNDDKITIEITSKRGNAVLMSLAEYESLQETVYLLRSPVNARRLLESLEQAKAGGFIEGRNPLGPNRCEVGLGDTYCTVRIDHCDSPTGVRACLHHNFLRPRQLLPWL